MTAAAPAWWLLFENRYHAPTRTKKRFKAMQKQLKENTVHHWAGRFMGHLHSTRQNRRVNVYTPALSESVTQRLAAQYRLATKRLLLLDYDGTLVPYAGA